MQNPHHDQNTAFVIHTLNTVGRIETPPIPKVVRQSYSFIFLSQGEVLAEVGEESYLIQTGMFLLIPPGTPYAVKWYDRSMGVMGGFEPDLLLDPSSGILRSRHPVLCNIAPDDLQLIAVTLDKLRRDSSNLRHVQLSLDYILKLLDEGFSASEQEQNRMVTRFFSEVFDRTTVPVNVMEYAHRYGVTPNHLNKSVRNATGKPASEWIKISRINYAKYLLRDTDMQMIDIAARVGLFDQSYFARFFHKQVGITPTKYRQRAKGII